jgi:carboxylesterase
MVGRRALWLGASISFLGVAAYRLLWHVPALEPLPTSQPARSHAEARVRVRAMQAAEGSEINPLCRTQLLDHGSAARRVVVLLHGYTNCPHQFQQLAAQLHANGDTVFVPRLPLHGQLNRQPVDLGRLTPLIVARFVTEVIDIAVGLAPTVIVLGFSFGGVLAAWAAQGRPEIRQALLVSASFGLRAVPNSRRRLYAALLPRLPDEFRWWDAELKEEKLGPIHAYLGYSTRGIGTLLRLGLLVQQAAKKCPPGAQSICVVVNPSDQVVDNRAVLALAEQWRRHGAVVQLYTFPTELNLIHDLMDPMQPAQQVDKVYPILLGLLKSD